MTTRREPPAPPARAAASRSGQHRPAGKPLTLARQPARATLIIVMHRCVVDEAATMK